MESYEKEQPVAFGDLYRSAMPVRLRRASSASRAKNQERGRAASERRTALRSFEGRVHDLGRRTKDGFAAFDALLGGRWTDNGGRLLKMESVPFFLARTPIPSSRSAPIRDLAPWNRQSACAVRAAVGCAL